MKGAPLALAIAALLGGGLNLPPPRPPKEYGPDDEAREARAAAKRARKRATRLAGAARRAPPCPCIAWACGSGEAMQYMAATGHHPGCENRPLPADAEGAPSDSSSTGSSSSDTVGNRRA